MNYIIWVKADGTRLRTNDKLASVAAAETAGWHRETAEETAAIDDAKANPAPAEAVDTEQAETVAETAPAPAPAAPAAPVAPKAPKAAKVK